MARRSKNRLWMPMLLAALVLGFIAGRYSNSVMAPGPQPAGSATLTWVAPTQNVNDSPLTDLAGFVIRCWSQSGQLTETRYSDDPLATTYTIDNLVPGIYHCAVSAVNEDGDESALSNVVANIVASK